MAPKNVFADDTTRTGTYSHLLEAKVPNQSHSKCNYGTVYKVKTSKLGNTKDYDSSRAFIAKPWERKSLNITSATNDLYALFTYIVSKQPFFGLRLLLLQCGVWFLGKLFLTNTTNKFLPAAFPFESRVLCHYYIPANSPAFPGVS